MGKPTKNFEELIAAVQRGEVDVDGSWDHLSQYFKTAPMSESDKDGLARTLAERLGGDVTPDQVRLALEIHELLEAARERYGSDRLMSTAGLRALVTRLHPDTTVRELERRGGFPDGWVSFYLRPTATVTLEMVQPEAVGRLASALGCPPGEVVQAMTGAEEGRG